MKNKFRKWLQASLISLPVSFALIFFGFLPLRFDIYIYTNNIIGEGTCSTYLSEENTSFAYLYTGDAYFGSELKTLRLPNLPYNVKSIGLHMYDIDAVDFVSYDISMFGRNVTHVGNNGISHPFTKATENVVISTEEPIIHLENNGDLEDLSMSFPGSTLIPVGVWIAYCCFIILIGIGLACLVSAIIERKAGAGLTLMCAASILATIIMGCFLCGSMPYVDYTYFLLNFILLFATALLINSLTLPWLGTVLVSAFTLFWYIANYYVIQFRNKPIMPADLKAINTAKEVVGGYNFTPTWKIIISVIIVLLYIVVVIAGWRKDELQRKTLSKESMIRRAIGALVAVALLFFGINNPAFAQLNNFPWDARVMESFHREGMVLTFVQNAMNARVKKPEGYSREVVSSYLNDYRTEKMSDVVHPTRIIMVMNEAFSDLRTVGLDESIDVMPFIDSLNENTVKGSLYVSVIGGGTCNTEFEALTGNTLAFLGTGAYPYTENVTKPMFSLASYFGSNNYVTEAFHVGGLTNWNRNVVYPNLGFKTFYSTNDYPNVTYLHNYIADMSDYQFMELRDKENQDKPRFLFDVTIQNHSDYEHFVDVKEAETLKEHGDLEQNVRVYLSLIKISDDEIRQFVEKYTNSEEPTMIIFFGDHQPSFKQEGYTQVYTNMSKYLDFFKTKFFIWTNYETESVYDAEISANYLPLLILKRGNFPLPPYLQMLEEVHEKYPIISSQGVVDTEGNVYDNVAMLLDDPLIQKYQYIQYANLFDEIDPAWFEVP